MGEAVGWNSICLACVRGLCSASRIPTNQPTKSGVERTRVVGEVDWQLRFALVCGEVELMMPAQAEQVAFILRRVEISGPVPSTWKVA